MSRGYIRATRPQLPDWLQPLVDGYFRSLTRRGRSSLTKRAYGYELRDLAQWLEAAGVASLADIQRRHVEEWRDSLDDRKAARTIQVAATAARGLLRWCEDQELPMSSPRLWTRVEAPRLPRLMPKPIAPEDLQRLQEALAAPDFTDIFRLRSRALWWLLFSSGSRISPVLMLNRGDIKDGAATVVQKGGSKHVLLFSDLAVSAVQDYLNARTDDDPALILSHPPIRGGSRLTHGGADIAWNRLSRELSIGHFSSHSIRHTCATTMLRRRVDSLIIAKHLGHRGLGTIANYAEVALEDRRAAMAAMSA